MPHTESTAWYETRVQSDVESNFEDQIVGISFQYGSILLDSSIAPENRIQVVRIVYDYVFVLIVFHFICFSYHYTNCYAFII